MENEININKLKDELFYTELKEVRLESEIALLKKEIDICSRHLSGDIIIPEDQSNNTTKVDGQPIYNMTPEDQLRNRLDDIEELHDSGDMLNFIYLKQKKSIEKRLKIIKDRTE